MPAEVPEFAVVKELLRMRQNAILGPAATDDARTATLLHYQLFQGGGQPLRNSGEMQADGCMYFADMPVTSPAWYDVYPAADTAQGKTQQLRRDWAGDQRAFAMLDDRNRAPSTWQNTGVPAARGGPFPPGRGPAPQWFRFCAPPGLPPANWNPALLAQIPGPTMPLPRAGATCMFRTTDPTVILGGGIPEWVSPTPGTPRVLEGIVTNSFVSGEDCTCSHIGPPPGYWLGVVSPLFSGICQAGRPDPRDLSSIFRAINQLCNDLEGDVWVDPQYRNLLAAGDQVPNPTRPQEGTGNFRPELDGNMVLELEQWLVPVGYRPEPGDRILTSGRWIVDCGHADWHTELHPLHLIASTFLQTGPLGSGSGGTVNRPPITDMWQQLTGGQPATVTKVVATGAWPGGALEFDIWPPPRPHPSAQLQWRREPGIQDGIRIASETPLPAGNPNHIRVRIEAPVINIREVPPFNRVDYLARRLVTAYLAWWNVPTIAVGGRITGLPQVGRRPGPEFLPGLFSR